MKKYMLVAAMAATAILSPRMAFAQQGNDPVVIEVGGRDIHQSEFVREFNENVWSRLSKQRNNGMNERRKALSEYAGLYAIFQAKLLDAHARGMDTTVRLYNELKRYRSELAAPYLLDSSELQRLIEEAYERNKVSLRAAHILVPIPIAASDEDTVAIYETAWELYNRIAKDGEDFSQVAFDYKKSRNPGAEYRADEGDLGYFSVFNMVYPFETAAYNLKVGEVSTPVRTRYGYHIIKLLDRVEGIFGRVTMAHIWLSSPDSATRQADINMMYRQLQEGAEFAQVARQSDDRSTAENGGEIPDASLSQLPPEYIHRLATMKMGEISKPFHTQYGWHIIKLISRDTLPARSELESYYKQRMARDQRGGASRKLFARNTRAKYGILDLTNTPAPMPKDARKKKMQPRMMASLAELVAKVPDSVRLGLWKYQGDEFTDTSALAVTPSQRYTSRDVAGYIAKHQKKGLLEDMGVYVRRHYEEFLDSISIAYADSQLEKEHADFAEVVEDYRRGLLIFNYNDAMIWRKAQDDSVGFSEFYARESVKKKLEEPADSVFFYNVRARVTVLDVADAKALPAAKAQKIVEKARQKKQGGTEMRNLLMKRLSRKHAADEDAVRLDVDLVEKGRQSLLDNDQWQEGVYCKSLPNGGYRLLVVDEVLPRTLKGQKEARGYYLNAWQNEVERRLIDDLTERYHVKIHRDVIGKISL